MMCGPGDPNNHGSQLPFGFVSVDTMQTLEIHNVDCEVSIAFRLLLRLILYHHLTLCSSGFARCF